MYPFKAYLSKTISLYKGKEGPPWSVTLAYDLLIKIVVIMLRKTLIMENHGN
jgi:hypothetical protein